MHIPDNYLSPVTSAVIGTAMIPIWAISIAKLKKEITDKKLPLLGISAAFSFLIMMLNVPLPGGTTGHAVGSVLISILLGPFSACLTVTIALLIQALFFGDGGILSFGTNCFNMAFVMPFTGFFIYRFLCKIFKSDKAIYINAFLSGYFALNITAFIAALEFGLQPLLFKDSAGLPMYNPYPLSISIPAMMIPHLLIVGFVEALITAGVLSYIKKMSPGLIYEEKEIKTKPLYLLILFILILTPLGLIAPGTAWGEWAIDEIKGLVNFIPSGMSKGFTFKSLMPDYTVTLLKNDIAGYLITGIIGIAVLIIIFKIISQIINKSNKK